MKKGAVKIAIDALYFVVGAAVYSAAVNIFLSANGISPGGFTGLATVVNYLTAIPTGIVLFVFNIPVLILGYIKLGGAFILKTSFVTAMISVFLDISPNFFSTA